MAATEQNITVEQGATYRLDINVTDDNGGAFDLTGYTARGKLRTHYDASSEAASFTTTITSATGKVRIELSATVTAALTADSYVYDVEIEAPDGEVNRLLYGTATLNREATK